MTGWISLALLSWLGVALLVLPGAVVARFWLVPVHLSLGAGAGLTLGWLGFLSLVFPRVAIPWNVTSVGLATVLALVVNAVLARRFAAKLYSWMPRSPRRSTGRVGVSRAAAAKARVFCDEDGAVARFDSNSPLTGSIDTAQAGGEDAQAGSSAAVRFLLAVTAIGVGALTNLWFFARGMPSPEAPAQTWDAMFHQNAIAYIARHHSADPFTSLNELYLGQPVFYPALWDGFWALLPADPVISYNASTLATPILLAITIWAFLRTLTKRILLVAAGAWLVPNLLVIATLNSIGSTGPYTAALVVSVGALAALVAVFTAEDGHAPRVSQSPVQSLAAMQTDVKPTVATPLRTTTHAATSTTSPSITHATTSATSATAESPTNRFGRLPNTTQIPTKPPASTHATPPPTTPATTPTPPTSSKGNLSPGPNFTRGSWSPSARISQPNPSPGPNFTHTNLSPGIKIILAALALLTGAGATITHPSAAFGLAVLGLPALVQFGWPPLRRTWISSSAARTKITLIATGLVLGIALFSWLGADTLALLFTYERRGGIALSALVDFPLDTSSLSVKYPVVGTGMVLGLACLVAVAYLLRISHRVKAKTTQHGALTDHSLTQTPRWQWLGIALLLTFSLDVLAAGPDWFLRVLAGPWYTQRARIAPLIWIAAVGVLIIAFDHWLTHRPRPTLRPRTLLALTAVVALVGVGTGYGRTQLATQTWQPDEISFGTMLTAAQIASIPALDKHFEPGTRVITNPAHGGGHLYALSHNIDPVFKHLGATEGDWPQALLRPQSHYPQELCAAAKEAEAGFYIRWVGDKPNNKIWGLKRVPDFDELDNLPEHFGDYLSPAEDVAGWEVFRFNCP